MTLRREDLHFSLRIRYEKTPVCCSYRGLKIIHDFQRMLEGELKGAGYKIIPVDLSIQKEKNGGFGYLFDHDDVAAELAKQAGADYILVGRFHKPSFLFGYVMGHLIKADNAQLLGNFIVESKGGEKKLTLKAVEALAVKIDKGLDNTYTPPEPKH